MKRYPEYMGRSPEFLISIGNRSVSFVCLLLGFISTIQEEDIAQPLELQTMPTCSVEYPVFTTILSIVNSSRVHHHLVVPFFSFLKSSYI